MNCVRKGLRNPSRQYKFDFELNYLLRNFEMDAKEALLKAIQAERYGNSFYMMAANSTTDPQGKNIFETLAAEEMDHMNFLLGQYNSILKTGKVDTSLQLGRKLELNGPSPIFSDALKGRIKDAHYEMSALAIGVQLELDAMNFYRSQSASAIDPVLKMFFTELAEWESGHYHALLRQQEALKEDYWSDAGFSPF
jgi:rubrerythrin